MDEHRPSPRVRTFLAGRLIFNQGASSLDCIIRNVSETGAKLEASGSVTVPECCDLLILAKGETRPVRIVWRHEETIGVHFADRDGGAEMKLAARLKAARDENTHLREMIQNLVERQSAR